jgi:hypothetical protein
LLSSPLDTTNLWLWRVVNVLTIYNVFDLETFLTAVAPGRATLDPGAEKAAQRLSAVGAEPDRRVSLAARMHRIRSL